MSSVGSWLVAMAVAHAAKPRVAVVISDDLEAYTAPAEAFLSEIGETPLVFNLNGRRGEADAVIRTLGGQDPSVVLAVGAKAAYAVRNGMPDTPLVYTSILDPGRYGIDGAQVTGVTMAVDPVTFLSQFVGFFSDVQRIGVIRGPNTSDERMLQMAGAAAELGLRLEVRDVDASRQVRGAFLDLAAAGVDALWVPPDREVLSTSGYRTLTEEARRRHLPLLVDTASMVQAGAVFTLVPDPAGIGAQAAEIVRKVADGAAPSVIQAQDPDRLLVVLNLRTVEQAGLELDRLLLDFADVVIE